MTTKTDNESVALKKRIAELEEQIKLQGIPETQSFIDIRQDEYIKVVSLCPMPLNISTLGKGQGVVYRFARFGEEKRIVYSHLAMIIESCRSFAEKGFFYIMDSRVVSFNGLDDYYNKLLTKDTINSILDASSESVIDLFANANKSQQNMIVSMLISKVRDGEYLDLNLVDKISRISGVNIQKEADEAKQFTEMLKEEK